jgi:transposase
MEGNDVDVWFEDECHFQQHGSRCAMWVAPEVKDPVVMHAPTRKSIGLFGAVRACDGCLITSFDFTFNADTFKYFLRRLLRHRRKGRKILVVLDNARWHHARAIKPWLERYRNKIELLFLPAYSPELNPIERVWKLARRLCVHNRYFAEFSELIDTLADRFYAWSKPNKELASLCSIN